MRWSIVLVIFRREVRDELRDRRTLFMIFVLPILLYPILGIGALQMQSAFEQKPRKVIVVGAEFLPADPPLLNADRDGFEPSLFDVRDEAGRMIVEVTEARGPWLERATRGAAIRQGAADSIVVIPEDLRRKLDRIREEPIPIQYESTSEQSQTTYLRVKEVLARWKEELVKGRVAGRNLPPSFTDPIQVEGDDVAPEERQGVNVWARLFPFLLVMMSLTGAFYPSVDLCAGEKERGTMETLLISPASRGEIVMGKFLTVVLASILTALLNIISMGLTGVQFARHAGALAGTGAHQAAAVLAAPSLMSAFWMVLLLIPLSVFFSAICVALAVLAKSMKEGQYYMTPLYLTCIPLVFLTLVPGIELNLFYSLVPVTGVSLLLRALILGEYAVAWRFFLPVLVPTVVYGAFALRWAVDQFHREEVLFREAERFDVRHWVRHLLRDKEPTPTGGEALLCFALMLSAAWFLMQYLATSGLASSTASMAAGQIAFILTPPLAMALLLTSSPRRTLRLNWPNGRYLGLGVGLAIALNPLVNELKPIVERLFPMSSLIKASLAQMMAHVPSYGIALLLFAAIPAVCEEVAFRGFILSGLERGHRERSAILLSALLFGFLHVLLSLFQQLFNATLLGLILGLLAVRSRSLLPGILFHFTNNALAVSMSYWLSDPDRQRAVAWLYRDTKEGLYNGWIVALSALASGVLLAVLLRSRAEEGGWRLADGLLMRCSPLTLTARYVFPVEGPPIADGCLTIMGRKIARVGPADGRKADLDLGNVAITPGFVNAHTHLELSALNRRDDSRDGIEDEVKWLRRVVDQRRAGSGHSLQRAIKRNLAASVAAGTTLIADTTTAGLSWDHIARAPVRGVVFAEMIGLKRSRGVQTSEEAMAWLGTVKREAQIAARARPGLSPHAPYSTAEFLYQKAVACRLPLSTHLAEMPAELELLRNRSGPLRDFLEDLGAWDEQWEPIGPRPADYVRKGELRDADWLIAHGTYFEPDDFWQFRPEAAPHGHRVAIAYCPRTHARFGHAPHPYRGLLEHGAVVCLGTDSLASSPTLSVLDEMRFLHRRDPALKGALLLTMGTLFGAWALRSETIAGSLKAGKSADLAVVALPDREEADPYRLLLDSDLPVVDTVFEGEFVTGRWAKA